MAKLREIIPENETAVWGVAFFCPGCGHMHAVFTGAGGWLLTGTEDAPTIEPSIVNRMPLEGGLEHVCHLIVCEGFIEYQNDCTHFLAGTTIPLPVYDPG